MLTTTTLSDLLRWTSLHDDRGEVETEFPHYVSSCVEDMDRTTIVANMVLRWLHKTLTESMKDSADTYVVVERVRDQLLQRAPFAGSVERVNSFAKMAILQPLQQRDTRGVVVQGDSTLELLGDERMKLWLCMHEMGLASMEDFDSVEMGVVCNWFSTQRSMKTVLDCVPFEFIEALFGNDMHKAVKNTVAATDAKEWCSWLLLQWRDFANLMHNGNEGNMSNLTMFRFARAVACHAVERITTSENRVINDPVLTAMDMLLLQLLLICVIENDLQEEKTAVENLVETYLGATPLVLFDHIRNWGIGETDGEELDLLLGFIEIPIRILSLVHKTGMTPLSIGITMRTIWLFMLSKEADLFRTMFGDCDGFRIMERWLLLCILNTIQLTKTENPPHWDLSNELLRLFHVLLHASSMEFDQTFLSNTNVLYYSLTLCKMLLELHGMEDDNNAIVERCLSMIMRKLSHSSIESLHFDEPHSMIMVRMIYRIVKRALKAQNQQLNTIIFKCDAHLKDLALQSLIVTDMALHFKHQLDIACRSYATLRKTQQLPTLRLARTLDRFVKQRQESLESNSSQKLPSLESALEKSSQEGLVTSDIHNMILSLKTTFERDKQSLNQLHETVERQQEEFGYAAMEDIIRDYISRREELDMERLYNRRSMLETKLSEHEKKSTRDLIQAIRGLAQARISTNLDELDKKLQTPYVKNQAKTHRGRHAKVDTMSQMSYMEALLERITQEDNNLEELIYRRPNPFFIDLDGTVLLRLALKSGTIAIPHQVYDDMDRALKNLHRLQQVLLVQRVLPGLRYGLVMFPVIHHAHQGTGELEFPTLFFIHGLIGRILATHRSIIRSLRSLFSALRNLNLDSNEQGEDIDSSVDERIAHYLRQKERDGDVYLKFKRIYRSHFKLMNSVLTRRSLDPMAPSQTAAMMLFNLLETDQIQSVERCTDPVQYARFISDKVCQSIGTTEKEQFWIDLQQYTIHQKTLLRSRSADLHLPHVSVDDDAVASVPFTIRQFVRRRAGTKTMIRENNGDTSIDQKLMNEFCSIVCTSSRMKLYELLRSMYSFGEQSTPETLQSSTMLLSDQLLELLAADYHRLRTFHRLVKRGIHLTSESAVLISRLIPRYAVMNSIEKRQAVVSQFRISHWKDILHHAHERYESLVLATGSRMLAHSKPMRRLLRMSHVERKTMIKLMLQRSFREVLVLRNLRQETLSHLLRSERPYISMSDSAIAI